jgi:hypothetical protein
MNQSRMEAEMRAPDRRDLPVVKQLGFSELLGSAPA